MRISTRQQISTMAMIPIVVALGLAGVVIVLSLLTQQQQQQAEAAGGAGSGCCNFAGIAFNASLG